MIICLFKQKTADEMRISDWSSDVCSSDLPGNRAGAFGEEIAYGVWRVDAAGEGSAAVAGEKLVVADDLAEQVKADAGIEAWTRLGDAGDLAGTVLAHPWRGVAAAAGGYDFGVQIGRAHV